MNGVTPEEAEEENGEQEEVKENDKKPEEPAEAEGV
jgi:hypothetical protein